MNIKEGHTIQSRTGKEPSNYPKTNRDSIQTAESPIEQILHLQRTVGNPEVHRLLRSGEFLAKRSDGQPKDIYEQEADRLADRVMRMPSVEPTVSFPVSYLGKQIQRVPINKNKKESDDNEQIYEFFTTNQLSLLSFYNINFSEFPKELIEPLSDFLMVFETKSGSVSVGNHNVGNFKITVEFKEGRGIGDGGGGIKISNNEYTFIILSVINFSLKKEINTLSISSNDGKSSFSTKKTLSLNSTISREQSSLYREGRNFTAPDITFTSTIPSSHVKIEPMNDDNSVLAVTAADSFTAPGTSRAKVVPSKIFKRGLEKLNIPQLNLEEAITTGVLGGNLHIPAFNRKMSASGKFGKPLSNTWQGNLGELSYRSRMSVLANDLNRQQWMDFTGTKRRGNFPIWDTVGKLFSNDLTQVKSSVAATPKSRFQTYDRGLNDIMGGKNANRQQLFRHLAIQRFQKLAPAEAVQLAQQRGKVAVNSDDLVQYRDLVINRLRKNPGKYSIYLDALLAKQSIQSGNQTYSSVDEIKRANITNHARNTIYRQLGERVSKKIVSNGISTQELKKLRKERASLGTDGGKAIPKVFPEYAMVRQMAAKRAYTTSAIRGGALGGALSTGVEVTSQLMGPDDVDWERLIEMGGVSTMGTGGGAWAETAINNRISQSMLERSITGRLPASLARGIGGGTVGVIMAPFMELGIMALDNQKYTVEDYTARGTRAAVGGFIAGALSAAAVGAVSGSVAPGVGTAIGFVVGFGAYLLYDLLAGDAVEDLVRSAIDHKEKKISSPVYRLKGNWEVMQFRHFSIGKKISLSDDVQVSPTGTYVSQIYPDTGAEIVFLQVIPLNDRAKQLFKGAQSVFVPAEIISPVN